MKPYHQTWRGNTRVTTILGASQTSVIQTTDAGYKVLSNVVSVSNTLRRKMGLPNATSYQIEHVNRLRGSYSRLAKDGSGGTVVEGQFGYMPYGQSADLGIDNNVYNDALSGLFEQVRGELDLSIDFLQHRQVSKMVGDSLRVLRRTRDAILSAQKIERLIASSHKRDRYNGYKWQRAKEARYRADMSKNLADNWLQWQYGVKPLMNSVYETVKTFQNPQQPRVRLRSRAKRRTVTKSDQGNSTGLGIGTVVWRDNSKRVELVAEMAFAPSVIDDVARFSSLNPASIVWEMIPYSFVIDWVYDVGGYLRNLESALMYTNNFVSGYSTITIRESGQSSVIGTTDNGTWLTSVNLTGGYYAVLKNRAVLTSLPFPRAPRLGPKLGWQRLVSGAALLRQLIRR